MRFLGGPELKGVTSFFQGGPGTLEGIMTTNFELLKVRKMTSLKIYISQVMEKLGTSDLDIR